MARLIPHTRGPWIHRSTRGMQGSIVGGVVRQYARGHAQDQLFMACGVGEDNGGNSAHVGNSMLCAESVAMYLALELIAAGKARLATSDNGPPIFVFGHVANVLSGAADRWTLVITAIGWDRVYRELGE